MLILRCSILLLLMNLALTVLSDPIPVLTIQSPDGNDIIDCINKLDQPALSNPLLKNHHIQDMPTGIMKTGHDGLGLQVWHANGKACPVGTIPIRRFEGKHRHTKYESPLPSSENGTTNFHLYAVAFANMKPVYGTRAFLNVWSPIVGSGEDFSLGQIWIRSGLYADNTLNAIEVGWQIYPNRYGDHQPRLFTYWTRDAYVSTGCYGTHCDGFVVVSNTIALEAAMSRTSISGGEQFDIGVQVSKDIVSGNWWLAMGPNLTPVGYWPAQIFTSLADHAIMLQWGGEVFYPNTSSSVIQMGSGAFPDKGQWKAAYFCDIRVAHENRTFLPVQDFEIGATRPEYYSIKKAHSTTCGNHFYYGGPGPVRSASVRGTIPRYMVLLFLSVFLFV